MRPALSVPASDLSKVSNNSENTANGSNITRDSKEIEYKDRGKCLRPKLDWNTKSNIEVSSGDPKQKRDDSIDESVDTENGHVTRTAGDDNCAPGDPTCTEQSSSNHIGGNKTTVISPS